MTDRSCGSANGCVSHPLEQLIRAADAAITAEDYDTLMDFYADDATLVVKPGLNVTGKDNIRKAFVAIAEHLCVPAGERGTLVMHRR